MSEMPDEYWTVAELRAYLKLGKESQYKTWWRVKHLFAGALCQLGPHKLYHVEQVKDVLAQRWNRKSPVSKPHSLRRAPA